jgi:hypothetical protein
MKVTGTNQVSTQIVPATTKRTARSTLLAARHASKFVSADPTDGWHSCRVIRVSKYPSPNEKRVGEKDRSAEERPCACEPG